MIMQLVFLNFYNPSSCGFGQWWCSFSALTNYLAFIVLRRSAIDHSECNSNAHQLTASLELQYVSSPNFPGGYGTNLDCNWAIRKAQNFNLIITILSFQTEDCCDFLKVNVCKLLTNNCSWRFDYLQPGYSVHDDTIGNS